MDEFSQQHVELDEREYLINNDSYHNLIEAYESDNSDNDHDIEETVNFEFINKSNSDIYYAVINKSNVFMTDYFHSDDPKCVRLFKLEPGHSNNDLDHIPHLDISEETRIVIGKREFPLFVYVYKFDINKQIYLEYNIHGLGIQGGSWWSAFLNTCSGHSRLNTSWSLPKGIFMEYHGPKKRLTEDDFINNGMQLIPFYDDDEYISYTIWTKIKLWIFEILKY